MSASRFMVAALLLFAGSNAVGVASACINNCQPVAYICSNAVSPSCGHTVCVSAGSTVPFCKDVPGILSCGYTVENTAFVGVTYHGCTAVDGYVCTDPAWFGGHGIWGFVCKGTTPFSLP